MEKHLHACSSRGKTSIPSGIMYNFSCNQIRATPLAPPLPPPPPRPVAKSGACEKPQRGLLWSRVSGHRNGNCLGQCQLRFATGGSMHVPFVALPWGVHCIIHSHRSARSQPTCDMCSAQLGSGWQSSVTFRYSNCLANLKSDSLVNELNLGGPSGRVSCGNASNTWSQPTFAQCEPGPKYESSFAFIK